MRTLRIRVNRDLFLLPLPAVERIFEAHAGGQHGAVGDDPDCKVVDLDALWGAPEPVSAPRSLVVVSAGGERAALLVSSIEGIGAVEEGSVKPIGRQWLQPGWECFSGACRDDQGIALMIDPGALLQHWKGGS